MKVCFICGYYSDLAHRSRKRTEDYWDAYFFVWAVKTGQFKRPFSVHFKDGRRERITADTGKLPRRLFGNWLANQAPLLGEETLFVPVPSKDATLDAAKYRSLDMVREALASTSLAGSVLDALRWTELLPKAHEGGPRGRTALLPYLRASDARGMRVILVDDLFSTGGSLLAARDCLTEHGADVLGALTCGRTIYDFETRPFGTQSLELEHELADWQG